MTDTEKKLLQAQHRLEEAQARDRVKERKARTRRLIQEGAILEKVLPEVRTMELSALEGYLFTEAAGKRNLNFRWEVSGKPGAFLFFSRRAHLLTTLKGRWYLPCGKSCALRGGCGCCGQPPDNATAPASAAVIVCAGLSCFRFGNSLRPARTNLPPAALFAAMTRSSTSGHFLFCERETEKERTR